MLIHYHYLAEPEYQDKFRAVIQQLNCSPGVLSWIDGYLDRFTLRGNISVCLCTLAIHEPYRSRAITLYNDIPLMPWVVLTDAPEDFANLNIRAIAHAATGPMAVDYLKKIRPTGDGRGAAAYHDKRFALMAALEDHDTAIFLDADSRISGVPRFDRFPGGLSVLPVVRRSVAEHLQVAGTWRLSAFEALAKHLTGSLDILHRARWCQESCIAVTKDGRESIFFEMWGKAAEFMQDREVYSGEGGVIGLAAAMAGWTVDYEAVASFGSGIHHEAGGPKGG